MSLTKRDYLIIAIIAILLTAIIPMIIQFIFWIMLLTILYPLPAVVWFTAILILLWPKLNS